MGRIQDQGSDIYRDNVTAGVPASGPNEPAKSEIRAWSGTIDNAITEIAAAFVADNATVIYAARSSLFANLTPADRTIGIVYNDTAANNGIYVKNGAAGAGSWNATGLMLQGQQGESATIAVGTVTSGSAPAITNSGTASAAVLNFVLQRGADGKSFLQTAIDTGYVPAGTTEAQLNDKIVGQITAAALAARDKAQDWAEGSGEPGGSGTKSSKAWAGEAKTYRDQAAASAGQASAGAAPLIADFVNRSTPQQRNRFDADSVTAQSVISPAGEVVSVGGYFVTDYILVAGLTQVSVNYPTFGNNSFGYALFDQAKAVVGGAGNAIMPGTPLAIPAGAAYIRISVPNGVPLSDFMVVGGATIPTNYRRFNDPDIYSYMDTALVAVAKSRRLRLNLFDRDAASVGKIPQIDQQQIVDIGAGYSTTDFIPVRPGAAFKTYPASSGIGAGYGLFWFDKDLKYVGSVAAPFTDDQVFTPPPRAVFVRFPYLSSQADSLTILPATVPRNANIATHKPAYLTDASQWAGKNFCQIGDSISATLPDGRWAPDAIKRLGGNFALDGAAGGRKMVDALRQGVGNALFVQSDFENIDAVNIWLGTNDYGPGAATPLGVITDAATAATFYGYTKKAVEQLLTWKPALSVTLSTPMYRKNADQLNSVGLPLSAYQQAIRDVGALYSLPINDVAGTSGVNFFNEPTVLYDGLHPNALGLRLLGGRFVGFYRGLAPNDPIA